MKRISKAEARERYGIIVSGASSMCRFYLTDDGRVIDDCGSIRFIPKWRVQHGWTTEEIMSPVGTVIHKIEEGEKSEHAL